MRIGLRLVLRHRSCCAHQALRPAAHSHLMRSALLQATPQLAATSPLAADNECMRIGFRPC